MMDQQPSTATPWRRDLLQIESGLAEWARSTRGADSTVTNLRSPGSGMANDTVLFQLDGEPVVARLAPAPGTPYPTFPTFDLAFQKQVIDLVRARTDVPAPEIVHLELSEQWLGAPFLLVRAIDGVVASDNPPYLLDPNGWFLKGTPGQWQQFETSTIEVFARLHRIADVGEDTAFLRWAAPGKTALEQQLNAHRDYYEWGREGYRIPILERAFELLAQTLPANDRSVLNWGDARPGNIIYQDFRPVGVLDWEMAGVGPPEVDVAWTTFFQRFYGWMAESNGLPPVPAMFGRAKTVEIYESLSDTKLDDLSWYEALAGLRFGIILARMSQRGVAYGVLKMPSDPDDLIMFVPLLEQLLREVR